MDARRVRRDVRGNPSPLLPLALRGRGTVTGAPHHAAAVTGYHRPSLCSRRPPSRSPSPCTTPCRPRPSWGCAGACPSPSPRRCSTPSPPSGKRPRGGGDCEDASLFLIFKCLCVDQSCRFEAAVCERVIGCERRQVSAWLLDLFLDIEITIIQS